jgi:hypothetical protein
MVTSRGKGQIEDQSRPSHETKPQSVTTDFEYNLRHCLIKPYKISFQLINFF